MAIKAGIQLSVDSKGNLKVVDLVRGDVKKLNLETKKSRIELQKLRRQSAESAASLTRLGNKAKSVFGFLSAGIAVKGIVQMIDGYKNVNALLNIVSTSQTQYNQTQKELFAVAQSNYASIRDTTKLYAGQAKQLATLGYEHVKQISAVDLFGKALSTSGATTAEASAATLQWVQALGSGVLRGQEFNSIMENGRGVAIALADGLNTTIGNLRNMALKGKLSAKVVVDALLSQEAAIKEKFAKIPITIGKAWTQLTNSTTVALSKINDLVGDATGTIANLISGLSGIVDNLDFHTVAVGVTTLAGALTASLIPAIIKTGASLTLAFATNPVLLLATAITGTAVALSHYRDELVTIGDNTSTVRDFVVATWDYVKESISNVFSNLSTTFSLFSEIVKSDDAPLTWGERIALVSDVFVDLGVTAVEIFKQISARGTRDSIVISATWEKFKLNMEAISTGVRGAFNILWAYLKLRSAEAAGFVAKKFAGVLKSIGEGFDLLPGSLGKNIIAASEAITVGVDAGIANLKKGAAFADSLANISNNSIKLAKQNQDEIISNADASLKAFVDNSDKAIKKAWDTKAVDQFKDAVAEIGKKAESRRFMREMKTDIEEMGGNMNDASINMDVFNGVLGKTEKAIKPVIALTKEQEKAAESLAKSKEKLKEALASTLVDLEKERLKIGKNEVQLYKLTLESKRYGKEKLKMSATDIAHRVQLKASNVAYEKLTKSIKEQQKEIKKATESVKLDNIEFTKGKAARFEAELAIKKITGALKDKLVEDYKENLVLEEKNDLIKESKDRFERLQKKVAEQQKIVTLLNTSLKGQANGLQLASLMAKGYSLEMAKASVASDQFQDSIRTIKDLRVELAYEKDIFGIGDSKRELKELEDIYGKVDAKVIQGLQNQRDAWADIRDVVSSIYDSVIDAFKSGGSLKDGLTNIGNTLVNVGKKSSNFIIKAASYAAEIIGAVFSDTLSEAEIAAATGRKDFNDNSLSNLVNITEKTQYPMLELTKKMKTHLSSMDNKFGRLAESIGIGTTADITGSGYISTTKVSALGFSSSTREMVSAGIDFALQTIGEALYEFDATKYTTFKITRDRLGGLISSESLEATIESLGSNVTDAFEEVLGQGADMIVSSALILGHDVEQQLKDHQFDIGFVDFTGLDDSQIQERLNKIFSEILSGAVDSLSGDLGEASIVSLIENYRNVGEESLETIGRLAVEYEQASYAIGLTGKSLTDGVRHTTEEVTAAIDAYTHAYAVGADNAQKLFDLAWNMMNHNAGLLGSTQEQVLSIVRASGGLELFNDNMNTFVANFYDETERFNMQQQYMLDSFNALGVVMPETNDQFRNLVNGIDTSSEHGATLYAELLGLSGAFASLEEAEASLANTSDDLGDSVDGAGNKIINFVSGLNDMLPAFNTATDSMRIFNTELLGIEAQQATRTQLATQAIAAYNTEFGASIGVIDGSKDQFIQLINTLSDSPQKLEEAIKLTASIKTLDDERIRQQQIAADAAAELARQASERAQAAQEQARAAQQAADEWQRAQENIASIQSQITDLINQIADIDAQIAGVPTTATEAIQDQIDAQQDLISGYRDTVSVQQSAYNESLRFWEAQRDQALAGREYLNSLLLDQNLTTLTPLEQLAEAQSQFNAAIASGDVNDSQSAMQTLLGLARDAYSSTGAYDSILANSTASFDALLDGIEAIPSPSDDILNTAKAQLANSEAQLELLREQLTAAQEADRTSNLESQRADLAQKLKDKIDELALAKESSNSLISPAVTTVNTSLTPLTAIDDSLKPESDGGTNLSAKLSRIATRLWSSTESLGAAEVLSDIKDRAGRVAERSITDGYGTAYWAKLVRDNLKSQNEHSDVFGTSVIPAYAGGTGTGGHPGGLRIVGEKGWELESTGPSQIHNQSQISDALRGDNRVVNELKAQRKAQEKESRELRKEVAELRQELSSFKSQNAQNHKKGQGQSNEKINLAKENNRQNKFKVGTKVAG